MGRVVAQPVGQCGPVVLRIFSSLGVPHVIRPDLLDQLEDVDEGLREGVHPPVWGRGCLHGSKLEKRENKKVELMESILYSDDCVV